DPDARLRPHRPRQHPHHLWRGGAQQRHPGRGRFHDGADPRARHQPHRHRRQLRRIRAPDRPVDEGTSRNLLPRQQDRRPDLPGSVRLDPPLARTPADRPARPDPAPQSRRAGRMGHRDGSGRRARSRDPGARRGARPLHRRDRPRHDDPRHAQAVAGALRFRFGAPAVQLPNDAKRPVRRGFRDTHRHVRGAERRHPDDQGDHEGALGRACRAHRRDLVRAAPRSGRDRHHHSLGTWPARRVPQHGRGHPHPADGARRRRAVRSPPLRRRNALPHGAVDARAPLRL
ncbi:MAG: Oxidoreductase, aldo/keto reductase family, partial [uncultured Thermomicrobiales bacterium]